LSRSREKLSGRRSGRFFKSLAGQGKNKLNSAASFTDINGEAQLIQELIGP
jgi:hypothetical protein